MLETSLPVTKVTGPFAHQLPKPRRSRRPCRPLNRPAAPNARVPKRPHCHDCVLDVLNQEKTRARARKPARQTERSRGGDPTNIKTKKAAGQTASARNFFEYTNILEERKYYPLKLSFVSIILRKKNKIQSKTGARTTKERNPEPTDSIITI